MEAAHPQKIGGAGAGAHVPPPGSSPSLPVSDKIHMIERHFREIMLALGLDLMDDSLKNTPLRVARMYVNEIFSGLDPLNEPSVTLFENKYRYGEIILEKDIPLYSYCEHHFVPIIGKAHVAYIAGTKIAGLSKLNRVVRYFSKRPQASYHGLFEEREKKNELLHMVHGSGIR